jgi:predicted translin family RNA/ssDNA-binding protein
MREEILRLAERYAFASSMSVSIHQQGNEPLSRQWYQEAEKALRAIRERLPA